MRIELLLRDRGKDRREVQMNQESECHASMTFPRKVQANRGRSYDVRFLDGFLDASDDHLATLLDSRRALLVTTPTVARLYGPRLDKQLKISNISVLTLVCNERHKTLDQCKRTVS